ncbi:MAG: penicillin acylase family protein [Acidobacteriota bacterium]
MKKTLALLVTFLFAIQLAFSNSFLNPTQSNDLEARARAALAQTSGTIELAGLMKPVEVLRDEWGVPHLYAESQEDLFFAQGFVAAQDRLWQMELWRRTGEGRLSEILGAAYLERDKFARLCRYRGDMQREWQSYAPDTKRIIESFVGGVNAFIELSRHRLPIEFQLTGIQPELWTPEVCLTRMAGYIMTRNASSEVLRAQLVKLVGAEKAAELLATDPQTHITIPDGLDLNGIDSRILALASAASAPISFGNIEGSNNWVVSGKLSATGKPILANDPHRPILTPSLRYISHLVAPGWNVIGAGEPTIPGIAAGHNERVGFGFTIVGIDQQDLYVEEVNPQNPNEYLYKGKWEKMRVERERLKVKGSADVEAEFKFTRHGAVLFEDKTLHRAYALKWVGSEPGTAGYLASLSLNRAKNWKAFLKALERWKVPSENLVYADVDGNIGWVAAGLAPVRKNWNGLLPVPGKDGKYEWQGFLPVSELPQSYNPANGFIATANHNILPEGYKHALNFEFSPSFRAIRIKEVLGAGKNFTVEDFKQLQHDETSLVARELVPLMKGVKINDATTREAAEMLLNWNFVMAKESPAAAIFAVWLDKLRPNVFKFAVSAETWKLMGGRFSIPQTITALKTVDSKIFGANAKAARDAAMIKSLEESVSDLTKRFGADKKSWRWGALHIAEFKHQLSGKLAGQIFDLPTVTRGGDANTVNATGGGNFKQNAGASYRQILDVSNWDNSVAVNVPGQSGQPFSPHYGDLLSYWAEGKYFPLLFSREKIEQHTKERLKLVPKARLQK